MTSARLLVPAGTPDQDSCGDTLSPTQFGFCGFLLATFFGIMVPSLKVVEESAKADCAFAVPPMHHDARIMPPAATRLPKTGFTNMSFSFRGFLPAQCNRFLLPTKPVQEKSRFCIKAGVLRVLSGRGDMPLGAHAAFITHRTARINLRA